MPHLLRTKPWWWAPRRREPCGGGEARLGRKCAEGFAPERCPRPPVIRHRKIHVAAFGAVWWKGEELGEVEES